VLARGLRCSEAMRIGRRAIAAAGGALYLFGRGLLTGVATERIRFDGKRQAVLRRYERLAAEWRARLMGVERAAAADRPAALPQ
jgi:hypothetical protein